MCTKLKLLTKHSWLQTSSSHKKETIYNHTWTWNSPEIHYNNLKLTLRTVTSATWRCLPVVSQRSRRMTEPWSASTLPPGRISWCERWPGHCSAMWTKENHLSTSNNIHMVPHSGRKCEAWTVNPPRSVSAWSHAQSRKMIIASRIKLYFTIYCIARNFRLKKFFCLFHPLLSWAKFLSHNFFCLVLMNT